MIVRELLTRLGFTVDEHSLSESEKVIEKLKESAETLVELYASWEAAKKLYELVNQVAELGEETLRTSIKLGIGAEALQELQYAANQAGTSAGSLQAGLRFLARNASAAANGSGDAAKEFESLGINVNDAHGQLKPMELLMGEVSDALKGMTNKTERTAKAIKIFGRGGLEMLPFLVEGSAKIKEQREEAEKLGGVMGDDLLEQSERYIQMQKKLSFAWAGIRNLIAKSLLPVFESVVETMKDWLLANREMIQKGLPAFIGYAVRLVKVLADLVIMAGRGWVMIVQLVDSLGPAGRAILEVAAAAAVLGLAFLSPAIGVGLLVAAIALLVEDIEGFHNGKESLFGHLVEWISSLNNEFLKAESDNPFIRMLQDLDKALVDITNDLPAFGASLMEDLNNPLDALNTALTGPHSVVRKLIELNELRSAKGTAHAQEILKSVNEYFSPPKMDYGFESNRNLNRAELRQEMHTEIHVNGGIGQEQDVLANLIAKRVGEVNDLASLRAMAALKAVGK